MRILTYPDLTSYRVDPGQTIDLSRENAQRLSGIADQMIQLMRDARGIGLAATQVGLTDPVVVVQLHGEPVPRKLYRPAIAERDGYQISREGCLSFPGASCETTRSAEVVVDAHEIADGQFRQVRLVLTGVDAILLQHEIEHLDGRTMLDSAKPKQVRQIVKKFSIRQRGQSRLG